MKLPDRKLVELLLSLIMFVVIMHPSVREPRVWWWMTMRGAREAARRAGQVAIWAEQRYRQEVA